jgi:hypothetical protein
LHCGAGHPRGIPRPRCHLGLAHSFRFFFMFFSYACDGCLPASDFPCTCTCGARELLLIPRSLFNIFNS